MAPQPDPPTPFGAAGPGGPPVGMPGPAGPVGPPTMPRMPAGPPTMAGPVGPVRPVGPPTMQRAAPVLPPGYRWIAVRPGSPPAPPRRRRHLSPTPRYQVMPRWGLKDPVVPPATATQPAAQRTASTRGVRVGLVVAMAALGVAALVYLICYGLMMYNRTTLLPTAVSVVAVWSGRVVSAAAVLAVIAGTVLATGWLVARRAAAFAHARRPETRRRWMLWLGCLLPVANLFWAPVYVIELATVEGHYSRLRKPILRWWLLWVLATGLSVFATATRWADDAQGIANNVMAFVLAYLAGSLAVAAAATVIREFDARPVEKPAHRWVVVSGERDAAPPEPAEPPQPAALESEGQEPAA